MASAYYIQKEIFFHNSEVVVYYQSTTVNENVVWTDVKSQSKSFSKKNDATKQASLIPEPTKVVKLKK